jgi:hypothetical protein
MYTLTCYFSAHQRLQYLTKKGKVLKLTAIPVLAMCLYAVKACVEICLPTPDCNIIVIMKDCAQLLS